MYMTWHVLSCGWLVLQWLHMFNVAQNYSYVTSTTEINNAAASQLLTTKQAC